MKVFMNPMCSFGEGKAKWERVEDSLRERIGEFDTELIKSPSSITHQVSEAVANGENQIVAAGGDGTVNLILNAILNLKDPSQVTLGAVGLGSSNDFHKPQNPFNVISGIPLRTDFQNAHFCDVIRISYHGSEEKVMNRYCLINASIGITAEGNAIFSAAGKVLTQVQKLSVDLAIILSALKAIITFRDITCKLVSDEETIDASVSNLGIIKNPHFTGKLCYDTPIMPDDGKLGINLSTCLNLPERLWMLYSLYNQRFSGLPKTKSWKSKSLEVSSNCIYNLEIDGELVQACKALFTVIPKKVRCCR